MVGRRTARTLLGGVVAVAVVAAALAPVAPAGADPVPSDEFVVGAATRSIVPTEQELAGGLYLGGYGLSRNPNRRALGSDPDLSARALVIGVGEQRSVIITIDAIGMGNLWMRAIREAVASSTGISARAVMVHVSHSHASLDFQGIWGGVTAAYRNRVVAQAAAAATAAQADLGPATLKVATVQVPELHGNRRGTGFTDDTMSVLQFSRPGGATVATLVNYGAHPTVLGASNQRVGTDFVGPAQAALEDSVGGVGFFVNATLGDLSPRPPASSPDNQGTETERLGRAIAARATAALATADEIPAGMATAVRQVSLQIATSSALYIPVSNPGAAALLGIELPVYYDFSNVSGSFRLATTVSVVRLGDDDTFVSLVALPGEPLSNLGKLQLRPLLGGVAQFLFATTNDSLGYLLPDDEWRDPPGLNTNYEEFISFERAAGTKVVAGVEAAAGSLSSFPMADFTDVPGGASFDQGVDWLASNGITQGTGARTFGPTASVNRSQMARFLWRMMGRPAPSTSPCGFTDLGANPDSELVDATCWLKGEGITTGINQAGTLYGPAQPVLREQMAGFLWRLANRVDGATSCGFTDAPQRAEFKQAACWLKSSGITTGTNQAGTTFAPTGTVTRGQMASFLFRLVSKPEAWQRPLAPTAP